MNDVADTPLKPPRRALWKTLVLSGALLMSGVVIGIGLTLMGIRHRLAEFQSRPDLLSQRVMQRVEKDLDLTPAQSQEIRKIFAAARKDADEMRQRNRAQAQAFFREFQADVSQVLTPSQQKEWNERFRKARERAMHHRPGDRDGKKGERPGSERDPDSDEGSRGDADAPAGALPPLDAPQER